MVNKSANSSTTRPRQSGKRCPESLTGTDRNRYFENRVRKTLKLNVVALKISGVMK